MRPRWKPSTATTGIPEAGHIQKQNYPEFTWKGDLASISATALYNCLTRSAGPDLRYRYYNPGQATSVDSASIAVILSRP